MICRNTSRGMRSKSSPRCRAIWRKTWMPSAATVFSTKASAPCKSSTPPATARRLPLTLVYNPIGAKLPPDQAELEADYKEELQAALWHRLHPALHDHQSAHRALRRRPARSRGSGTRYMELLANSFNPATVAGLMCRSTINIGWQGEVFDCDFNQMLGMQLSHWQTAASSGTSPPTPSRIPTSSPPTIASAAPPEPAAVAAGP